MTEKLSKELSDALNASGTSEIEAVDLNRQLTFQKRANLFANPVRLVRKV
jgi:hypothetical protein